jgi:hypothetical protein
MNTTPTGYPSVDTVHCLVPPNNAQLKFGPTVRLPGDSGGLLRAGASAVSA